MSIVLYDGPSVLDGSTPVIALITGNKRVSKNVKTGPMLQTWILLKDVHPIDAVRSNLDAAICGSCVHRGDGFSQRSCYVRLDTAPSAVWKSKREILADDSLAALGLERSVRLGAYGDPAAVPFERWELLLADAPRWTGYTHQWRTCDQRLKKYCMASVETIDDMIQARAMGWRTFRVEPFANSPTANEVACPAAAESGHKAQCFTCHLCKGTESKGKNVVIQAHGLTKHVNALRQKVAAPNQQEVA